MGTPSNTMSAVRQNYHETSEAMLNEQINMELYASYVYQAAARHFQRDDVALLGFAKFFQESSDEEREHAERLQKYQLMRGGRITYAAIQPPPSEYENGLTAMEAALELERNVNAALLKLHKCAEEAGDSQMTDFIEGNYLNEQVEGIKMIADYVANLKRVGPGLGEYMFDKETLGGGEPLKFEN